MTDGLPDGLTVGHWSDPQGRTGCTVVLAPEGAVVGVDVGGGGAGRIGTDALRPDAALGQLHALLLTGGSTFGLDAAAGVKRYLEETGVGFEVAGVRVPIVAGAVIFDLLSGYARARPGEDAG